MCSFKHTFVVGADLGILSFSFLESNSSCTSCVVRTDRNTCRKNFTENTIARQCARISYLDSCLDVNLGIDAGAVVVTDNHHCYLEESLVDKV